MHKYFAKPLFLGKKIEFLPECHSTNDELQLRLGTGSVEEGFVIHTDNQVKGKGQRGSTWLSEPGQNILFSILLSPSNLLASHTHFLNLMAGLAVCNALDEVLDQKTELKWPNDVYVSNRKIAGILVETILSGNQVDKAIVGIGINLNQSHFPLPVATSVKMETGKHIIRDDLLLAVLAAIEEQYLILKSGGFDQLKLDYYKIMRWRGELHEFKDKEGVFEGEIIGIEDFGRLMVKRSDRLERYDVKEIQFLH